MKSFNEHMKSHLGSFLFATVAAIAVAVWAYKVSGNFANAFQFALGCALVNICFLFGRTYNSMTIERNAIDDRVRWENSMLRAMQLAKEADVYYDGNPNIISAFHAGISAMEQEGITKGYLNVGRL